MRETARNLAGLPARSRAPVKLIDHMLEVFGDFYGQVPRWCGRRYGVFTSREGHPATGWESGAGRSRRFRHA
ncbi:hypothetical protein QLX52_30460 [Streptomyces albus]|uniref:hypothetical protein n=1 Tax=Streptomyces albus TaxID=1888 RepID=UPI0024AE4279|nr:hypothetical protein [Streptomyces albus]MDI6413133.1 hypothetical protein [Streptomyces albus]